jgi:hypothetical protein
MKEVVRQTASREADLPAIFHKTWQAENPDFLLYFLLCRIRLALCPSLSPFTLVLAHLCSPAHAP